MFLAARPGAVGGTCRAKRWQHGGGASARLPSPAGMKQRGGEELPECHGLVRRELVYGHLERVRAQQQADGVPEARRVQIPAEVAAAVGAPPHPPLVNLMYNASAHRGVKPRPQSRTSNIPGSDPAGACQVPEP